MEDQNQEELVVNGDYQPIPAVIPFHTAPHKEKYLKGAWGSGKTIALCREFIFQAMEFPGSLSMLTRLHYGPLRDSTVRVLKDCCDPRLLLAFTKDEARFINGSTILFRNLDSMDSREGGNLSLVGIDEVSEIKTEYTVNKLMGRLRNPNGRRQILMVGYPPNKSHWLYNRFVLNPGPDRLMVTCRMEDNPYLPEDYVKSLDTLPENMYKKYVLGDWGSDITGKAVFGAEFNEELHCRPVRFNPKLPLYRSIDFGFLHPCVLWAQRDALDRCILLREYMPSNIEFTAFIKEMLRLEELHFPGHDFIQTCADVAGKATSTAGYSGPAKLLSRMGIFPLMRKFDIHNTLTEVRTLLSTLSNGLPMLLISDDARALPVTREALAGSYIYSEHVLQGQRHPEPLPIRDEYYEHPMDCLRYLIGNFWGTRCNTPSAVHHNTTRTPRVSTGY